MNNKISIYVYLLCTIILSSCAPKISNHGQIINKDLISNLKNKSLTKSEIASLIGSPSLKGTYSENTWYYISHVNREFAYFPIKKLDQIVIKIRFDKDQKIQYVKAFSKSDGKEVKINQFKTATKSSEMSILKELFGNIGRFNK